MLTIKPRRTGFDEVLERAEAFAATLGFEQLTALYQPYKPAMIRNWSNYPQRVLGRRHRRIGLSTATLDARQWNALDDLLAAASGTGPDTGIARLRAHLAADDHLRELGGAYGYGRGEFTVAFLGTPARTSTWQLQFGGHHLAVAHTYVRGRLAGATPSFRGIEPNVPFVQGGVWHEPEKRSQAAFADLLASLGPAQLERAKLRGTHDDLLLGPGRDWRFPARSEGLAAVGLTGPQRDLLLAAIASYVEDVADEDAARILTRYAAQLDRTHLGWSGTPALERIGDYVRVDGPSVWIELSIHDGIVCAGPHPHAVWRDKVTDYGGTRF